jgi:hypothetical protein
LIGAFKSELKWDYLYPNMPNPTNKAITQTKKQAILKNIANGLKEVKQAKQKGKPLKTLSETLKELKNSLH